MFCTDSFHATVHNCESCPQAAAVDIPKRSTPFIQTIYLVRSLTLSGTVRIGCEVSSSDSTSAVYDSVSRSGCTNTNTESVKMRKQKSPKYFEGARDRQRLARRTKRAAKAHRTSKDHTVLDDETTSENGGESIRNDKSPEGDKSSGPFLKLEEGGLQ